MHEHTHTTHCYSKTLFQPPGTSPDLLTWLQSPPCSSIPWATSAAFSVLFPFGEPCGWVGFEVCAECLFSGVWIIPRTY